MKQTGSFFAKHAYSAYCTISLMLRNLQQVLCYLPIISLFTFLCRPANHPRGTNFHVMFLNLPGSRVN